MFVAVRDIAASATRGSCDPEGARRETRRRLARQAGAYWQRESGLVMANTCRLVIPVYMRAGRPRNHENGLRSTTF